jgi:hypothetical protein
MQNNVNATNVINYLVQNFGENQVATCDAGVIKLSVSGLGNGDILSLSNLLQWADIKIRRSGTKILCLFVPKPDFNYSDAIKTALDMIEADGATSQLINYKWQYLSSDGAWNDASENVYSTMKFSDFKERVLSMGFQDAREISI